VKSSADQSACVRPARRLSDFSSPAGLLALELFYDPCDPPLQFVIGQLTCAAGSVAVVKVLLLSGVKLQPPFNESHQYLVELEAPVAAASAELADELGGQVGPQMQWFRASRFQCRVHCIWRQAVVGNLFFRGDGGGQCSGGRGLVIEIQTKEGLREMG